MTNDLSPKGTGRRRFLLDTARGTAVWVLAPSVINSILTNYAEAKQQVGLFEPSIDSYEKLISVALSRGGEFADIYFQYSILNGVTLEENKIRQAQCGISMGVGVRVISGEKTGYAYSDDLSFDSLKKAAEVASYIAGNVPTGKLTSVDVSPRKVKPISPININPNEVAVREKSDLLWRANKSAYEEDSRVIQVMGSFWDSLKHITVANSNGVLAKDQQIMTRLNVTVTVEEEEERQNGYYGGGGRIGFDHFDKFTPEFVAKEAVRMATTNLEAVEAPAGMQTVVLGNGWAGILLHEAIGHGLEADFNRKKTSLYSDRIGEKVASDGVTVIDEGIIPNRRGSVSIDDEGEPTRKNILIEDGVLRGYMCDHLNAKLMGLKPTGNGRRESFKHYPMPRMTNTYMLPGKYDPREIIESVKSGFYAKSFGGGQVDISNGNFVFQVTEGYLIEEGKITRPVKGANLIGVGPEILSKVEMIGNDLELDSGIGSCGKNGQTVPVGVGLPTTKIASITVGGTAIKGKSMIGNT
ncbi:MAG: metalloprotease TldD [Candidatus Zixiibacteriota bacterium]|nr:MAG: metalloprotease TldD [candidate division Zixibacteria bacterium]